MYRLEVKNVSKSFAEKQVLQQLKLHVAKHEIVSILGPSGVGKSTLFNIIAGLLAPCSGDILLDGQSVLNQPGHIAYMLQKDLLLAYKTVEANVALPLILRGMKQKDALDSARQLLAEFKLAKVSKSYPKDLSGGMRQRIALLRTYLFSSNLLLLDEPFSALDNFTKTEIHEWYLKAHQKLKLTTLFITHDIDEAIMLSNRIYIMNHNHQLHLIKLNKETLGHFKLSEAFLAYKKEITALLAEKQAGELQ